MDRGPDARRLRDGLLEGSDPGPGRPALGRGDEGCGGELPGFARADLRSARWLLKTPRTPDMGGRGVRRQEPEPRKGTPTPRARRRSATALLASRRSVPFK